ncbi:MAG TPA: SRPBCC family protein [Pseudolabrys sp.]|jgi:carbon monoxide dehydrogenase subunit G
MKIEKSFVLKHPRAFVWSKFTDVAFVAECLPGASIVSTLGENRYRGRMSVKVGPMAAAFEGDIAIETQEQAWTGVVSGKGADARSSSRATGSLTYRLTEEAGATRVDIVSDFNLAGPLAQFGKGSIIQEIANRITAAFVENFEARLSSVPAAGSAEAVAPAPASQRSLDAGNLLWTILRERLCALFRGIFGRSSA